MTSLDMQNVVQATIFALKFDIGLLLIISNQFYHDDDLSPVVIII